MRESKKQPKVVVFSTPACPWCGRVKLYLRQRGIKFKDIDVAKDKTAARDMVRRTGQMGVPVLLIGSRPIVGFNKPLIDHLLGLK
ncbi:MAG: NrdH-redoxin [bacterium (Candidatus Stahlbacteria) CG08_land_8_20_14_0_20_40_26]|nr:MAG: NrdH-redoxin [bacterium (Candidatus Stahlbacteria) CG23_combo_of_CG06-09_8_20_14_all_40_9]PIS23559.1 MAG: NrdH-redoxin [bacterium (Candidatus Stahlbacteria) CG08_land_8_20_14_0_20_40_26]